MNDISPKEVSEILSHYTDLGYGIVIEGEDTAKIKQALSFARKTLTSGTPLHINVPSANCISRSVLDEIRQLYKDYQPNLATEVIEFGDALEKIIDNAPTVESEEVAKLKRENSALEQEMLYCRENWKKSERPQGEWIDERNDGGACVAICSNCKTLEVTGRFCRTCGSDNTQSFLKSFNFGADMRKGGAK